MQYEVDHSRIRLKSVDKSLASNLLTKVSVANFKGIQKVELDLSPLTVFVGENGSGKSTVLQALSMLKRSAGAPSINTDLPYANLGPLQLLVKPAQTALVTFEAQTTARLESETEDRVSLTCSVIFDTQGLSEYKTELEVGDKIRVSSQWYRFGVQAIEPKSWTRGKTIFNFEATNSIGYIYGTAGYSTQGQLSLEETKTTQKIYRDLANISSFGVTVLQKFFVVAPLRGLTEYVYPLQPNPTQDFSARGGAIQLGMSLASNLAYYSKTVSKISEWENEIVGVRLETELIPGSQVLIRNPDRGTDYVNEGFGGNQLLFVLERIVNSPPDSTIGIEEPEIHLHPKAQFNFGKWASRQIPTLGKQLILLTHSPDILSGILSSVRRKHIKPQDVAIWFFERKDDKMSATKSEIDANGKVVGPALKSFMESTAIQLTDSM